MRAARDRTRVLLVLLLALLAAVGSATPAATRGHAAQTPTATLGWLAPDTPATHHDLRDWLRPPVAARHALSTPLSDSWWAVGAPVAAASASSGHSPAGVAEGATVAIGVATTPSVRAPPVRVN